MAMKKSVMNMYLGINIYDFKAALPACKTILNFCDL